FGWANQSLACFTLWAVSSWLYRRRRGLYYLIGLLPACFMTAVCVTYICVDKIGFHLPGTWAPWLGVGVFCLSGLLFAWRVKPVERAL
ncbi:MAG: carbon starvation protein A, partial [Bacteroidales bacterium]|nr:carbon starvation protein A [Bacteroidales bacterium]